MSLNGIDINRVWLLIKFSKHLVVSKGLVVSPLRSLPPKKIVNTI